MHSGGLWADGQTPPLISTLGTKYFGGHSDLLCGILVVKTIEEWKTVYPTYNFNQSDTERAFQLHSDRTFMGNMMGSLEAWLLLRSLRTLHLRVPRHSITATEIVQWLNAVASTPKGESYDGVPGGLISRVWHSSLQGKDVRGFDPKQQMQGGWNATFAIQVRSIHSRNYQIHMYPWQLAELNHAARLPHLLQYFFVSAQYSDVFKPCHLTLFVGRHEPGRRWVVGRASDEQWSWSGPAHR